VTWGSVGGPDVRQLSACSLSDSSTSLQYVAAPARTRGGSQYVYIQQPFSPCVGAHVRACVRAWPEKRGQTTAYIPVGPLGNFGLERIHAGGEFEGRHLRRRLGRAKSRLVTVEVESSPRLHPERVCVSEEGRRSAGGRGAATAIYL